MHLSLFLCRTCSAAQRRPPAARFARCSSSHFLVLSSTLRSARASARGSSQASSRLPSKPHDADGLHTRAFLHLLLQRELFSSAACARSLCIELSHRHPTPTTTLQQPLLSVLRLVGRLMFALASATGATRRPFGLSSPSLSAFAFLRSPFFFWFFLCVPFGWLSFCVVRTDSDTHANLSTLCALPWCSNTAVH